MDSLRAWLCPTPAHRLRVVEASARIGKARLVIVGALGVGILGSAPWLGWWMLALFIPTGAFLITVDRWIERSRSPELIPFLTLVTTLVLLAGTAAGSGGPESPVLPFLVLVPAMATLRFRLAVSYALAGLAALLIVVVGFAVDPAAAVDNPVPMIAALVLIVNILGVCTALMQGELEHRDRAVLDPLTGLLNRTALGSRVEEIEQQARVTGEPVALVLLDLDCFKRVNDEYGHERGDAVLRDAAYEIRKSLRSFELVYRFGGEEFLVLLPGADIEAAIGVAERVRGAVTSSRPGDVDLTLSAGVAAAAGDGVSYDDLFRAADMALFQAKRDGRDRVVAAAAPRAALAA